MTLLNSEKLVRLNEVPTKASEEKLHRIQHEVEPSLYVYSTVQKKSYLAGFNSRQPLQYYKSS